MKYYPPPEKSDIKFNIKHLNWNLISNYQAAAINHCWCMNMLAWTIKAIFWSPMRSKLQHPTCLCNLSNKGLQFASFDIVYLKFSHSFGCYEDHWSSHQHLYYFSFVSALESSIKNSATLFGKTFFFDYFSSNHWYMQHFLPCWWHHLNLCCLYLTQIFP